MNDPNVSGQAYGFLAMMPIKGGEIETLRAYLEGFRERGERPFEASPRTHMARFVIVPDFHNDKRWKQRREERLEIPALIFSSNLDLAGGDIDSYLDEVAGAFAPHVAEIWGRCIGGPQKPEDLKAYLKHNQIDCGFFYAAYGEATVPRVKACLAQREQLMAFATRTQGMKPAALQQAFIKEFAS
jgi:hypothetical protein